MKDKRPGEHLWLEWTGDNFDSSSTIVFFTEEHVDIENEIVKRALASSIQRSGIVDSLSDGFKIIDEATKTHATAGIVEGERDYTICDENGETRGGDTVEEIVEITLVTL